MPKPDPCKWGCGHVAKNGTGKSAHERHCPQNPEYVPSKVALREQERLNNPNNLCPECQAAGVEKGFPNPGTLGSHRRSAHGVLGAHTATATVECTFPGCEFKGKTREGMLIHYSRKHKEVPTGTELVPSSNGVITNTASTAELRRAMRNQLQNRSDLVSIVKIAFPDGIQTTDESMLDADLSYIALTANVLERRG